MDAALGTLHTIDGRPVLRFERWLAHPPERVWRAVTDPAEMAHWFPAQVEVEPRVGATMRFSFGDGKYDLGERYAVGEVLEYDPPKVYAFRWVDSVLRFELLPEQAGCRLVFIYTLSGAVGDDRASAARTAPGWDSCLDTLAARLDGRAVSEPDSTWVLDRAERYVEAFGLAEGEVREHPDGYLLWFERDLVQAPEVVWAALTEGGQPVAVGSAPPVAATHGYQPAGALTEVQPPRVLEYAWPHDGAPAGRVRFEFNEQQPIGCRLVVTQTIPAHLADRRATTLAAWQTHLELLFAALWGDVRCPWPAERTEELRERYAARLR